MVALSFSGSGCQVSKASSTSSFFFKAFHKDRRRARSPAWPASPGTLSSFFGSYFQQGPYGEGPLPLRYLRAACVSGVFIPVSFLGLRTFCGFYL